VWTFDLFVRVSVLTAKTSLDRAKRNFFKDYHVTRYQESVHAHQPTFPSTSFPKGHTYGDLLILRYADAPFAVRQALTHLLRLLRVESRILTPQSFPAVMAKELARADSHSTSPCDSDETSRQAAPLLPVASRNASHP
jgi:hypothetical protein